MRTNIVIDDDMMAEALARSGLPSMREVVAVALKRFVEIERQKAAIEGLRGLGWEGDLDEMRTDKRPPEWG